MKNFTTNRWFAVKSTYENAEYFVIVCADDEDDAAFECERLDFFEPFSEKVVCELPRDLLDEIPISQAYTHLLSEGFEKQFLKDYEMV